MKRAPIAALGLAVMAVGSPLSLARAADVYRCEVNGVTTFVGSRHLCPNNSGERVGIRTESSPTPPADPGTGAATSTNGAGVLARTPARPESPEATVASCERQQSQGADFVRECLATVRRAEVRRIATARLAALSRAVIEFVSSPRREAGVIALGGNTADGQSTGWCEELIGDLMSSRNLDVVDDENVRGPEWTDSLGAPGRPRRTAAPILDEGFHEWVDRGGKPVVQGYVTFTWKSSKPIVLRMVPSCSPVDQKTTTCNRLRYANLWIYDSTTPIACNVSFVGAAYWPSWEKTMTPLHIRVPAGAATDAEQQRDRLGLPPRKARRSRRRS